MTTDLSSTLNKPSAFTNAVITTLTEKRDGADLYAVSGLAFDIGYLGSDFTICVPDGFITDGPTVPKWLKMFLPVEKMTKSSALHDYLRERLLFDKFTGDFIFLSALKVEGCPKAWRIVSFIAVFFNTSRRRAIKSSFTLTQNP